MMHSIKYFKNFKILINFPSDFWKLYLGLVSGWACWRFSLL